MKMLQHLTMWWGLVLDAVILVLWMYVKRKHAVVKQGKTIAATP